jgi:D-hexose-6-phosphate mutarotase
MVGIPISFPWVGQMAECPQPGKGGFAPWAILGEAEAISLPVKTYMVTGLVHVNHSTHGAQKNAGSR